MPFSFISWGCAQASHPWKEQGRKYTHQSNSTGHISFPRFPYTTKPQGLLTPLLLLCPLESLLKDPTLPKKSAASWASCQWWGVGSSRHKYIGLPFSGWDGQSINFVPPWGGTLLPAMNSQPSIHQSPACWSWHQLPGGAKLISQEWQPQPWVLLL